MVDFAKHRASGNPAPVRFARTNFGGAWHSQTFTSKPSWYAVIPREGGSEDIRYFFGPERSVVHTANARTEGNRRRCTAPGRARECCHCNESGCHALPAFTCR